MKKQIKRLSPHQNGKVFGVLIAVSSLPLIILMAFAVNSMPPQVDQVGNPVGLPTAFLFIAPVFYLIFGYISTAIGCYIPILGTVR